jgi:hypothetical protein
MRDYKEEFPKNPMRIALEAEFEWFDNLDPKQGGYGHWHRLFLMGI